MGIPGQCQMCTTGMVSNLLNRQGATSVTLPECQICTTGKVSDLPNKQSAKPAQQATCQKGTTGNVSNLLTKQSAKSARQPKCQIRTTGKGSYLHNKRCVKFAAPAKAQQVSARRRRGGAKSRGKKRGGLPASSWCSLAAHQRACSSIFIRDRGTVPVVTPRTHWLGPTHEQGNP